MSDPRSATLADRAERFGGAAETFLLSVILTSMVVLAAGQIALRNFAGAGIGWADEALRIMVLWVTMLGSVAASRDQRHVRIDALSRYLPDSVGRWAAVFSDAFAAAVCVVLAWCSYQLVADSFTVDDRVLNGELPAWTVQLILPVGFALIAYRYVVSCFRPRPRRDASTDDGH